MAETGTSPGRKRRDALIIVPLEASTAEAAGRKNNVNIDLEGLNQPTRRGTEDPRARLFREIKAHYECTKRKAMAGLTLENNKVNIKERLLRNLSQRYKETWKKLQNKTLFLSLLRISLMSTRLFGILAYKLNRRKSAGRHEQNPRRLTIGPQTAVARVHHTAMFLLLLFFLALFPVDLAFDIGRGVSQFDSLYALVYAYLFVDMCLKFFSRADSSERPNAGESPARAYLRGWFAWDLAMSLPYYSACEAGDRWARKLALVPAAVRICFSVWSKSPISNLAFKKVIGVFGFGNLASVRLNILSILLFTHLSACVWIFFIAVDPVNNWYAK